MATNINIDFSDRKTQIIAAILAVGIIGAGLLVYFKIMPRMENLRNLNARSAQLTQELDRILELRPQLDRMRIEVAQLQQEMDSLEALFPTEPDVAGLITSISRVARSQNIAVMNFRPLERISREYFTENLYEMSLLGSFHRIGNFFAQVANFDMIVNIDRVSLRASSVLMNDLQAFDNYRGNKTSDEMIRSVLVNFRMTTYTSLQGAQQ
ncbi:MAG: type 4a pilus biogenesis protein PilO [Chitinivibrionia bacterium]|nr:type 4a pilus biogenesis protein PilO [Chitinivibrionia bacterium]